MVDDVVVIGAWKVITIFRAETWYTCPILEPKTPPTIPCTEYRRPNFFSTNFCCYVPRFFRLPVVAKHRTSPNKWILTRRPALTSFDLQQ